MRPLPGDDAFARPRRPSDNDLSSPLTAHQQPQQQMTYVLADESTVDIALEHASAILQQHRSREPKKSHHEATSSSSSALSVSSSAAADNDKNVNAREPGRPSYCHNKNPVEALRHQDDDLLSVSSRPESPTCPRACATTSNPSQPLTPLMFSTPGPMSAMSSVSSRRNSFTGSFSEDLMHSQVLSVDGGLTTGGDVATAADREQQPTGTTQAGGGGGSDMTDGGSAPQLIMPSIKMPSRRPFTETGKAMGRLKVLVAGDSGVGKTSLIKAIVQSCQHIVHVDPVSSSALSLLAPRNANSSPPRRGSRRLSSKSDFGGTSQITEVFASTKPYPEWWSELDDSRILKRRRSIEDAVLDRNICFVDTPGYSSAQSAMETITRVVQYTESHLHRLSSNSLPDGDILNLVGGDGGVQVDAVFYLVSNRLKAVDIEYLRQLAPLTNIILLLAQSDLLSPEHIAKAKQQIQHQLQEANIKPFCFSAAASTSNSPAEEPSYPHAISSALGSDHDNMDASLLMSPDYVQPLIPTELASLVEQIFTADGTSWLRHAAARKYLLWRKAESPSPPRPMELYSPLLGGSNQNNNNSLANSFTQQQQTPTTAGRILTPGILGGGGAGTGSFALARVADHTQREERLAQIRLANWAGELQKSLANERARYEALARGERAVWLTERLGECVMDGTIVPVGGSSGRRKGERKGRRGKFSGGGAAAAAVAAVGGGDGGAHHQDPLGLLEVVADLRRKGIVVLEVVGSLGLLGGVAVWVCRHYAQGGATYQWVVSEWERLWGGR